MDVAVLGQVAAIMLLASLVLLATGRKAEACFSVIVGKKASATGRVILGHNEDTSGRLVMQLYKVPRRRHEPGAKIVFEEGLAEIPQASETWAYFWSEARAPYPGISYCDFFVNEWGVGVTSDNCGPSREDRPELTEGGIGYGLRRIVAERARTAREGVEIAARLLDEYGYAASGRSYQIVDKDEGWMLQAVNGKHYIAKRVADDEVALIPNHYTIRNIDLRDKENYLLSPGLIDYAVQRGWHAPQSPDGRDFDFARAFQNEERYEHPVNTFRHRHAIRFATGRDFDGGTLPFGVKPGRKIGLADVKAILRTHYEGTPDDLSGEGNPSPHYTKNRVICTGTTVDSAVVEFRDNPDFTVIWRASGRPCINPFVPWYLGINQVPEEYGWLSGDEGARTHFRPVETDYSHQAGRAWWTFQDLQNLIDPDYRGRAPEIREAWAAMEEGWQANQAAIEAEAAALYREDRDQGREYLTRYSALQAARVHEAAREMALRLAGPTPHLPDPVLLPGDKEGLFSVVFRAEDGFGISDIDTDALLLGPAYRKPDTWAKPVQVVQRGKAELTAVFKAADLTEDMPPGRIDLWLSGKTRDGKRLVARLDVDAREEAGSRRGYETAGGLGGPAGRKRPQGDESPR
ncbi:MAG TPA: C69 family dipeptidase [Selenomonadales bacterium]|nr:C69 family dipeptidase [Selenomonadales bacterium]